MEVRYPLKVLYTLGSSQLMLARADAVDCRTVKPRPNATSLGGNYASTTIKSCLSALCTASPELLADPRTDHSVYALDPLQNPELMVGRGLLTWLMVESARVVGTVKGDYVDGEDMDVLEVRLSLTRTVAVSRAQHASSLQNISQPSASTNPSPPSTPSGQAQTTRASTRLRIKTTERAKKVAAVATAATVPTAPKKRGRVKRDSSLSVAPSQAVATSSGPIPVPSGQATTIAGPSSASSVPSRGHSRVSSVSSLALSQAQSHPRPPTSFGSTSAPTSASARSPTGTSQAAAVRQPSPGRSLARLLLAASASSSSTSGSSNTGTPLFDSLVERMKAAGLLGQPGTEQPTATDGQKQALMTILGKLTGAEASLELRSRLGLEVNGESAKGKTKAEDESGSFLATAPSPVAPSPAPISAPSPATNAVPSPSPSTFATPVLPLSESNLGARKREPDDRPDVLGPKRARLGLAEGRSTSLGNFDNHFARTSNIQDGRSTSAADLRFGVSPSPVPPSPSISATSPHFSVASPSISAASPNLSVMSAPSPSLSNASPNILVASPYPYPYAASAPPNLPFNSPNSQSGAWFTSQPLKSTLSQPNPLRSTSSQSSVTTADSKLLPKPRKRPAREAPLHTQTDLPLVSGPFVTPREQIGLPRAPAPPTQIECPSEPERARGTTRKKDRTEAVKGEEKKSDKETGKREEDLGKDRAVRGVSEEEVRVMLADGYYPRGGLEPGHRRLFGAKSATGEESNGEEISEVVSPPGAAKPLGAPTPSAVLAQGQTQVPAPAPGNNHYRTASSSKYYRSSSASNTANIPKPQPQGAPRPRAPRIPKPPSGTQKRAPPIPKHSPVALPAIARLPMMMTSPIRVTGAREPEPEQGRKGKGQKSKGTKAGEVVGDIQPARQFPPSLNQYSPLSRLLKSAGVDSLGDVLGREGVLGLKGDGGWAAGNRTAASGDRTKAVVVKEQEREIVDLTSDAEEDELPVPAKTSILRDAGNQLEPKTPPHQPETLLAAPKTPVDTQMTQARFTTPPRSGARPLVPPRRSRASPDRAESPLFAQAEISATDSAYTQGFSSEGFSIPSDLPPSSPPPMSDSDADPEAGSGFESNGLEMYREAALYTDAASSEGLPEFGGIGYEGTDGSDAGQDLDSDMEDGDGWNETIRPTERGSGDLGALAGGSVLEDLDAVANPELDMDSLANFLDMLDGELGAGGESTGAGLGLDADLGQAAIVPDVVAIDAAALDFSWLDALNSGVDGAEFMENQGKPGNPEGTLGDQELTQLLAALGAG